MNKTTVICVNQHGRIFLKTLTIRQPQTSDTFKLPQTIKMRKKYKYILQSVADLDDPNWSMPLYIAEGTDMARVPADKLEEIIDQLKGTKQ